MEVNFFALKFTDFLKKLWHDLDLYQWPKIRTLTIHTTFMPSISPYFPSYILLIKVKDYWLDTNFWWWLTPKYIAFTRSYHKLEHWFICTSFRSQIPFLNQGQDCQYLWCGTDKQMWRPWLCRFENIYRAWQLNKVPCFWSHQCIITFFHFIFKDVYHHSLCYKYKTCIGQPLTPLLTCYFLISRRGILVLWCHEFTSVLLQSKWMDKKKSLVCYRMGEIMTDQLGFEPGPSESLVRWTGLTFNNIFLKFHN